MGKDTLILQRAIRFRRQSRAGKIPVRLDVEGVIGESPPMKACLEVVAKAATGHSNVLITGETGVGKELFVQLIHRNSPRAAKPFIVMDRATLPENLPESMASPSRVDRIMRLIGAEEGGGAF